jgi:hypothetical protein
MGVKQFSIGDFRLPILRRGMGSREQRGDGGFDLQ